MDGMVDAEDSATMDHGAHDDSPMKDGPPSDPAGIDGYDKLQTTPMSLKPGGGPHHISDDDDDLPSPSVVLSQVIYRPSTQASIKHDSPSPGRKAVKRKPEVIEISSDDPEPKPKRSKVKRSEDKPMVLPLQATRKDIETWPLAKLEHDGDRIRLLMVLMHLSLIHI